MADRTRIEWCDATWNPITGCTPCSPGCDHCYARTMVRRFPHLHDAGNPLWTPPDFDRLQFHADRLDVPMRWRKPRRVFVCSMSDMFHPDAPAEWRDAVWRAMWDANQHTYMILTKRPAAMREYVKRWDVGAHIWLGVTVCNQAEADRKIPILLETPAAKRFVSVEPMLGPVDLERWLPFMGMRHIHNERCRVPCPITSIGPLVDWVICGGETGPGARPMHPEWVRAMQRQCQTAFVPFFLKSWGEWRESSGTQRQDVYIAHGLHMERCGKARSGCEIDGREWHEFPGENR